MKKILLTVLCSTLILCLISCKKTSTKINGWGKEELIEELSKKNYSISLRDDTNDYHPLYTFAYDKDNDKFIVKYEVDNKESDFSRFLFASVIWSWGNFEKGTMKIVTKISYIENNQNKGYEREYDIKYHKIDAPRYFEVDSYEITKSIGEDEETIINFTTASTIHFLQEALEYFDNQIKKMTNNNLTIR